MRSHFLPDLIADKNISNVYDTSGLGSFVDRTPSYTRMLELIRPKGLAGASVLRVALVVYIQSATPLKLGS